MKKRDPNLIATIRDVEEIVGELAGTVIQMMADRFDSQDSKMATKDDIARLENKLNPTITTVDDHSGRIGRLEAKAA